MADTPEKTRTELATELAGKLNIPVVDHPLSPERAALVLEYTRALDTMLDATKALRECPLAEVEARTATVEAARKLADVAYWNLYGSLR